MRLRIIIPTWKNARSVTGVHEAQLFDNLRKGIISGLERHESDVAWGEGVSGPGCVVLRLQLRETKKHQAWQQSHALAGAGTESLAGVLAVETDRVMRGLPSWKAHSEPTVHILPGELVFLPFCLNGPDAVLCSARLETSGRLLGQSLARWLSHRGPSSQSVSREEKKDDAQTLHQTGAHSDPVELSAAPSP